MKGGFISDDQDEYSFECAPLNRLFLRLQSFFDHLRIMRRSGDPAFSKTQSRLMKDPSEILTFFDDALQAPGWPADDKIPDRFPPKTPNAAAAEEVKDKMTSTRLELAAAPSAAGPSISHTLPPASASHDSATNVTVPMAVPPTTSIQASSSSAASLKRSATERDAEPEAERPKPSKIPRKSKPKPPSVPVRRSLRLTTTSSSGASGSSAHSGRSRRTSRR